MKHEKSHEFNKDVHLLFVDFKAAHNSINRRKLWEVMGQLRILAKLIRMTNVCTNESKVK